MVDIAKCGECGFVGDAVEDTGRSQAIKNWTNMPLLSTGNL